MDEGTRRRDGDEDAEHARRQRIQRAREEADEGERESAAGPGYTARPADEEPEGDEGGPGTG